MKLTPVKIYDNAFEDALALRAVYLARDPWATWVQLCVVPAAFADIVASFLCRRVMASSEDMEHVPSGVAFPRHRLMVICRRAA